MLIELRQVLISYQDYHLLLLTHADLGDSSQGTWTARDLWSRSDLGVFTDQMALARPAPKFASRSLRRALLMPQVNPGSLYRCG